MDEQLRQQIVDDENLRLLRICFFIAGSLTAIASVFILVYMLFFTFVFTQLAAEPGNEAPPAFIGRLIGIIGTAVFLVIITIAAMHFVTGMRLKERRSRTFCMVIAGITCASVPMGTLLGVWTILVLSRPSVKRTFEERLPAS